MAKQDIQADVIFAVEEDDHLDVRVLCFNFKGTTMPVICAAIGCNNKFVKGSEIRFYRYVLMVFRF